MKRLFLLCAFFALVSPVQAALQVIPPQTGYTPSTPAPVTAPSVAYSQTQAEAHGVVTVEKSLARIPFTGNCVVKGNVAKTAPDFRKNRPSLAGTVKDVFAASIPAGWQGTVTEAVAFRPATGVAPSSAHWSEQFRTFLELNRLQGYVDVSKKHVYVQDISMVSSVSRHAPAPAYTPPPAPVASALRDAQNSVVQNPAYTPLMAAVPTSYAIRPGLLKGQLEAWCRAANFEMLWLSKNDFQIQGSQDFGNDFQKSIVQLFDLLYKEGRMSLKAELFLGNNILRVRQD